MALPSWTCVASTPPRPGAHEYNPDSNILVYRGLGCSHSLPC